MISKTNLYISDLLTKSNCVVIPSFGGFIANYVSAQYDAESNIYYPPSKQILFNKNLISNDGLLCRYIAEKENITFSEAVAKVENTVFAIKQSLQNGLYVELINLGFVFLDSENTIQFKKTNNENFLIEVFGLPPITVVKNKVEANNKPELKFIDRPAIASEKKHKKTLIKKYLPAFIFIPLALSVILVQNKTNFLGRMNVNVAGWNPFITEQAVNDTIYYTYKTSHKKFPTQLRHSISLKEPIASTLVQTEVASSTKSIDDEIVSETKIKTENKFYIVAGCFKSKANANKMIASLKKNNYGATIINKSDNELYRVAIDSFATKEAADIALLKIKDKVDTAWILAL